MQSQIFPSMSELVEALIQPAGESREIGNTLRHIAYAAQTFLGADACIIFPINPISGRFFESLTVAGNYVLGEDELSAECLRSGRLVQTILKQGTLLVPDLPHTSWGEEEPEFVLHHLSEVCSVAALALRIRQPHKPLGVLYLLYKTDRQFASLDAELFTIFADYVSLILQGDWLYHRYQEVARIGQEINHDLSNVDALFQKLQKHIGRILDADYALLLAVYQPQAKTLDIYQAEERHVVREVNASYEGACRYVIETQQTIFIRQVSKESSYLPFQVVRVHGTDLEESFIYVPLLLGDQSVGVLSIQHPQPNAYNHEDLFILKLLANHVALAVYNTRLYSSLNQLNETGQVLTQQFDSERALQTIVDSIKEATRANIVILYPYSQALQRIQPPCISGTLLDSESQQVMYPARPGDIVSLALRSKEAIFAYKSIDLYWQLQGRLPEKGGRFYQREKVKSIAVVPLYIDERVVGVLFVNFRQPQSFDEPQKVLIEGLAHYASIALKNSQTFGMLNERRIRELMILQKIDQELNRNDNLELKTLLNTILKLAHEHIPVTGQSSIMLYDPQKNAFAIGALTGPRQELRTTDAFIPFGNKGIMRWTVEHKKPARVNDVHHDPPWRTIYVKVAEDTVSELDVPLLDGDEVVGVLNFESSQKAAFHPEDEQFLVTLAGQAVLAIKKAQAYEREKRFSDRFRLLYRAGRELASVTAMSQLDQAYRAIIDIARELSESPVVIRRYDELAQELRLVHASWYRHSPPSERIGLYEGYNGRVARERNTLVVHDIYELPEVEYPRPADPTIRSLLITPILFKERYYGNLELSHEAVGHFWDKDEEFFEGLAQQLASTIHRLEIIHARQEMEQRALAAEEMSSIGQSAFEITHRLGNDLGLVESYVSDIRENLNGSRGDDEFVTSKLTYIAQAVRGVLELSEKLRYEVSGISDEAVSEVTLCSPRILLEDARAAVSLPPGIQISLEVENDVSDVRVMHNSVIDILRNLVTNAIEAMPGGGRILLRARNNGRTVVLEVSDTGIGISLEMQPKIFDLFYSTKQSSGFGLWSARRNALRNHGKLEVKSEPGQGTSFELHLPSGEGI